MEMQFDNLDERIRYYDLILERDLDDIPQFPLPEGYRFVFYRHGDRDDWVAIEKSAKEFSCDEQGAKAWDRYYGGREDTLLNRMVFIENAQGEKVATATAYFDINDGGRSGEGWLHWVAVRREYQGKGLSKPLISHVLGVMKGLGYSHAKIPTQTTSWLACRIYLDFGFVPVPSNAVSSRNGWRIMKALTDHAALRSFEAAPMDEITADV